MNKPMIENSDRGITLDKKLAWTIGVALLVGGIWIGTQLTSLDNTMGQLATRQDEDRRDIRANTADIVAIRTQNARVEQRLDGIEATTSRTDKNVERLYDMVRQQLPAYQPEQ